MVLWLVGGGGRARCPLVLRMLCRHLRRLRHTIPGITTPGHTLPAAPAAALLTPHLHRQPGPDQAAGGSWPQHRSRGPVLPGAGAAVSRGARHGGSRSFHHHKECPLPNRALSWLKASTTALTFLNLLRHYVTKALTHGKSGCWVSRHAIGFPTQRW